MYVHLMFIGSLKMHFIPSQMMFGRNVQNVIILGGCLVGLTVRKSLREWSAFLVLTIWILVHFVLLIKCGCSRLVLSSLPCPPYTSDVVHIVRIQLSTVNRYMATNMYIINKIWLPMISKWFKWHGKKGKIIDCSFQFFRHLKKNVGERWR